MKGFLKKRWHTIPVGIITAILLVCLVAGGVVAAATYPFFQANISVEVAPLPSP